MWQREGGQNLERIFTLSEANRLLPQLEEHLISVRQAKGILIRIKDEIKRASENAQFGGGSLAGPHYITALEQIGDHLRAIQEMGVLVKDLDIGLCDFPYQMGERIVYLCWKLGEPEIRWWHEIQSGFTGRQALEPDKE